MFTPLQNRACLSGSSASEPEEDTCILVLLWLWKRQPKDATTSLERSPETDCPDWETPPKPALPWQAKQEHSLGPGLLRAGFGRANAAPSAISYPLAASRGKDQGAKQRGCVRGLQRLAPPHCTSPARFKTQGLSPSSRQPFSRPWGRPSPPFSSGDTASAPHKLQLWTTARNPISAWKLQKGIEPSRPILKHHAHCWQRERERRQPGALHPSALGTQ